VLVTGAGGSIGSELCRQILKTSPKRLLLVEMSEFALYQIHQEIQNGLESAANDLSEDIEVVPLLASVCDEVRMNEIMDTWKPNTIYHAAAYKHVPMVEANVAQGVLNNVFGTLHMAQAARAAGACRFVLVSTDKAVRPTNIMGTTKRLAEMILQAKAASQVMRFGDMGGKTRFSMVRFGNVLGSSGSVVPLFRKQIAEGGPITLTHKEVTRYFMTIPEAAQLVIQSSAMALGGDVFVLDMGEPVRIYDLAVKMVYLSGLLVKDDAHPHGDIEIEVTGLRPGEKLYEELLIGDNPQPTAHPKIMKAHEEFLSWGDLQQELEKLNVTLDASDGDLIRGMLKKLVPGYQPNGDAVDWNGGGFPKQ
jgi:FlaA1/EpsC-like NDP-sugar epimerase